MFILNIVDHAHVIGSRNRMDNVSTFIEDDSSVRRTKVCEINKEISRKLNILGLNSITRNLGV